MHSFKTACSRIGLLIVFLTINPLHASTNKTVLFDESHGQLFHVENIGELDLSSFSAIFKTNGWNVNTNHDTLTEEVLTGVDVLIISGAMKPVTLKEVEAITSFINKGGKLGVMLHVGFPVFNLLHSLNVAISNGVIHEVEHRIDGFDINFNVEDLMAHEITNTIDHFSIYGGWALLPTSEDVQIVAQTSKHAWVDLNRDNQPDVVQVFATVLIGSYGKGQFVVFSDDAIFQNRFLKDNNYLLGENLVQWLAK